MTHEEGLFALALACVVISWPLFYAAGWWAGWRAHKESQHPQAPLGLKRHSGRAEALLIARFGLSGAPARAMADPFEMDGDTSARIAAPMPGAQLL